jgi:hypothetical protein
MVRIDPERARGLARGFPEPYGRGYLKLVLAHGLGGSAKAEAERLFREAVRDFDSVSGTASRGAQGLFLPLVEDIDPGLVPEFLWGWLAMRKPATGLGSTALALRSDAEIVQIVARYDRDLAAALWAPIVEGVRSLDPKEPGRSDYDIIVAQARLDPRAAVEWVESQQLPARVDERGQNEPRYVLSHLLALWSTGRDDKLLPYTSGPVEALTRRDLR